MLRENDKILQSVICIVLYLLQPHLTFVTTLRKLIGEKTKKNSRENALDWRFARWMEDFRIESEHVEQINLYITLRIIKLGNLEN